MQQLVPGGGVAAAQAAAAVRQGDGAPHLDEVAVEAGGGAAAAHCRDRVRVCTGRGSLVIPMALLVAAENWTVL